MTKQVIPTTLESDWLLNVEKGGLIKKKLFSRLYKKYITLKHLL